MDQDEKIYSVSEITFALKQTLEKNFNTVKIKGEISNLSTPGSGHRYFTLKDNENQIRVALFRGRGGAAGRRLEDGAEITVIGKLSLYGKRSEYQIIAEDIVVTGVGVLLVEFEKLKKKLAEKGIFDEIRKRKIPEFPGCIGIVTSSTGAAIKDIINVLTRRYPLVKVLIYPCLVQGDKAHEDIIKGINHLNGIDEVDVILITRGGGSIEDLWAFNSEELAYTVFDSEKPVVSAVGHEIDFTIADFAADLRAPTPSAAAEILVPESGDIIRRIDSLRGIMSRSLTSYITSGREKLLSLMKGYAFKVPFTIYEDGVRGLDESVLRLNKVFDAYLRSAEDKTAALGDKLRLLNPMNILEKGYSVVYDTDNNVIKDSGNLLKGDKIRIKMKKGGIAAEVEKILE
ncbi:MAG: exodeoxyribonuclease VII large subunit [Candidatus Goldiibacteriota bacterium]